MSNISSRYRIMKGSTVLLFLSQVLALLDRSLTARAKVVHVSGTSSRLWKTVKDVQALKNGPLGKAIYQILDIPTNTEKVVLQCKNNYYLIMKENGRLMGTMKPRLVEKYGVFIIQTYAAGVVRMLNVKTKKFIAINKKGRAYTTRNKRSDDTLFKQGLKNSFHVYHSYYYRTIEASGTREWYLAIRKRNGHLRRPSKTLARYRSIEFVKQDFKGYNKHFMNSR